MRNLMREIDESDGKQQIRNAFCGKDRIRFLNALDKLIQIVNRN